MIQTLKTLRETRLDTAQRKLNELTGEQRRLIASAKAKDGQANQMENQALVTAQQGRAALVGRQISVRELQDVGTAYQAALDKAAQLRVERDEEQKKARFLEPRIRNARRRVQLLTRQVEGIKELLQELVRKDKMAKDRKSEMEAEELSVLKKMIGGLGQKS